MKRFALSPHMIAVLVSLFCFVVYLRTLAPTVSFIDSGELAAVACTMGIAHPTGYPLFTLIGWMFAKLPIASEEIVRLNLMSAVLCAAGLYFFFLVVHHVLSLMVESGRLLKSRPHAAIPVIVLASSAGATLMLGFSETYWLTAVSVEVYSLHVFFLSFVTYTFLRANLPISKTGEGWWWLFGFSLGMSFTNHMTTVLLAPGFLYLYFARQGGGSDSWARIAKLAIPFLLGLSVYLYLPFRATQSPDLNWGNTVELERFLWHLSGKQYRVWIFSSTEAAGRQFFYFINTLPGEFAYIGLLGAVVGVAVAWRAHKTFAIFSLLLFLGCILYSINYDIHDIDSYFLLAYLCMAIWMGIGMAFFLSILSSSGDRIVVGATGVALGLVPLFVNFSRCDESRNYLVEDYTFNMFSSLRPNALVFSYQWDYWVSSSYYYQHVKGLRRDVTVIDKELLRRSWYLQQLKQVYPALIERSSKEVNEFLAELDKFEHDLPYNPAVIQDKFVGMILSMIHRNLGSRPVYVTQEIEPEFTVGFQRVPEGLALRLEADTVFHETPMPKYRYRSFERSGRLESQIPKLYGSSFGRRGSYYYTGTAGRDDAVRSFEQELAFDPTSMEAQRALRVLGQAK